MTADAIIKTVHITWQTAELILLTENGVQSVPQFPEMLREILRAFRSYFPVAVDGGIEGEHDSVINVFRVLAVETVPGNQFAVVQQLQYPVSAAQHLSLRYALILIFFISYRVFNNFGVLVFHHNFVLSGESHTHQTKCDNLKRSNLFSRFSHAKHV